MILERITCHLSPGSVTRWFFPPAFMFVATRNPLEPSQDCGDPLLLGDTEMTDIEAQGIGGDLGDGRPRYRLQIPHGSIRPRIKLVSGRLLRRDVIGFE